MTLFRPTELHKRLQFLGKRASKALSQNFLVDGNIISKLLQAASISNKDLILEIGPGPGAVSEAILNNGTSLVTIEKDNTFAKGLEELYQGEANFTGYCGDALQFPIQETLQPLLKKNQKAKLIASLPYNVANAIITKLVTMNNIFSSLTVIIQDEVARRFTAQPNTKDYGSLTLFLNYYSTPKYEFKINPGSFYPKPKVNSAAVTLHLKKPTYNIDSQQFFILTQTAFQQRRKMLRASLKNIYTPEQILSALHQNNLSKNTRPEDLTLHQFIKIFNSLNPTAACLGASRQVTCNGLKANTVFGRVSINTHIDKGAWKK